MPILRLLLDHNVPDSVADGRMFIIIQNHGIKTHR
jgi:hypothetical protein